MSEQHETAQREDERLNRWAREQAEIERQTDALVLRTITALVTAAEDLKSSLRRDVESILEELRRSKRGLDNEISLSQAERHKFRRELDQERDAVLADARAQAAEIVAEAERERDAQLAEVRSMEQRLRTLEGQIRAVLSLDATEAPAARPEPAPVEEPAPARSPEPTPFTPASLSALARPVAPRGVEPLRARPTIVPAVGPAPDDPDEGALDDVLVEPRASSAPAVPSQPAATAAAPPPRPSASLASTPAPARTPAPTPRPSSPPPPAPAPRAAVPARRRPVELVFDGVPGYQQASALERAVNDLLPGEEVEIVEFENSQLVLSVETADLEGLAQQLVGARDTPVEIVDRAADRASFRVL